MDLARFLKERAGNSSALGACHPGQRSEAEREPETTETISPWVPDLSDADASLVRDDS